MCLETPVALAPVMGGTKINYVKTLYLLFIDGVFVQTWINKKNKLSIAVCLTDCFGHESFLKVCVCNFQHV